MTNYERSVRLAHAMYEPITEAGLGGLPFADVAVALAIVGGMLLSGAYTDQKVVEECSFRIAKAMAEQAKRLATARRE